MRCCVGQTRPKDEGTGHAREQTHPLIRMVAEEKGVYVGPGGGSRETRSDGLAVLEEGGDMVFC